MRRQWYQVPEVWLVLFLLASAVVGSLGLVVVATRHPDHATAAEAAPTSSPANAAHAAGK